MATEPEVIQGELVVEQPAKPNGAIVAQPRRGIQIGSVSAADPMEVVTKATEIADALAPIIKKRNLFSKIQGREFVKVEGWTTLLAMLGVVPREVSNIRLADGGYEATVELVRANDGFVIGRASAVCGMDEVWAQRQEYARRSMAATRATGKAARLSFSWIMVLAGYEPTPAEEMDGVGVSPTIAEPQRKPPQTNATPSGSNATSTPTKPYGQRVSIKQANRAYAIAKGAGWNDAEIKQYLQATYGFASTKDITSDVYEQVCSHFTNGAAAVKPTREPGGDMPEEPADLWS